MFETRLDPAIIAGFLKVGVCNVVDVLDHQYNIRSWMSPDIKPIAKARIAGQAVTLLEVPCEGANREDVNGFFEAADRCGPGTIFVASMSGDRTLSLTGDLVIAALHEKGCHGAVLDGAVRDIDDMIKMGFPVFAAAVSPVDKTGKARTVGYNIPMTCGGAQVNPGDVVVADWDGVVVVPVKMAEEVLNRTLKVIENEDEIMRTIRSQAKTTSLLDIFANLRK